MDIHLWLQEMIQEIKKVYAYEQTPPKAVYTVHSYDQLANNKYMPFTTKYMDVIIERIEDLK